VSRSAALSFGSVIHELADAVARNLVPADEQILDQYLDRVWNEVGYAAEWHARHQRGEARDALRRFLAWHTGRPERQLLGSEVGFDVTIPFGARGIHVRGSFDRVEVDVDGAVHIVDLKTQSQRESPEKLRAHPQLGVYQTAVTYGAIDGIEQTDRVRRDDQGPVVGGAELVLLRVDRKGRPDVQQQLPLDPDEPWVQRSLEAADLRIRQESFPAITSDSCKNCSFRSACPAQPEGQEVIS
jgi:RecB family exonuclease